MHGKEGGTTSDQLVAETGLQPKTFQFLSQRRQDWTPFFPIIHLSAHLVVLPEVTIVDLVISVPIPATHSGVHESGVGGPHRSHTCQLLFYCATSGWKL